MLTPPSQELVVLLGLIGLLILSFGTRRRIRELAPLSLEPDPDRSVRGVRRGLVLGLSAGHPVMRMATCAPEERSAGVLPADMRSLQRIAILSATNDLERERDEI